MTDELKQIEEILTRNFEILNDNKLYDESHDIYKCIQLLAKYRENKLKRVIIVCKICKHDILEHEVYNSGMDDQEIYCNNKDRSNEIHQCYCIINVGFDFKFSDYFELVHITWELDPKFKKPRCIEHKKALKRVYQRGVSIDATNWPYIPVDRWWICDDCQGENKLKFI